MGREVPGRRDKAAGHILISALVLAHRPVLFADVHCTVHAICALLGGVHNVFGIKILECAECGTQKRH